MFLHSDVTPGATFGLKTITDQIRMMDSNKDKLNKVATINYTPSGQTMEYFSYIYYNTEKTQNL